MKIYSAIKDWVKRTPAIAGGHVTISGKKKKKKTNQEPEKLVFPLEPTHSIPGIYPKQIFWNRIRKIHSMHKNVYYVSFVIARTLGTKRF